MQRLWREFWDGWQEARWGTSVLFLLVPVVFAATLIVMLAYRQAPPQAGWLLLAFTVGILAGRLSKRYDDTLRSIRWRPVPTKDDAESGRRLAGVKGGEVRRRKR